MKTREPSRWRAFANWRAGWRTPTAGITDASVAAAVPTWPRDRSAPAPQARLESGSSTTANGMIWVTVLIENSVTGRDLKAEHGLSYYVRAGHHCLLFDTGQSGLLEENAREMGLHLEEIEAIALSHGHYDHTGGVSRACSLAPSARFFCHPAALQPKFARNPDGTSRSVGLPDAARIAILEAEHRLVSTIRPTEVLDGIFVTGEIPRDTDFEDTGGAFCLDEVCTQRDPLLDDQAMYFDTHEGVVVLLGCAHAGVVNTLNYVQHLTRGRPIHTLIGGMHLLEADPRRIERTFSRFRELAIQRLGPAHCTGMMPTARLRTEFPDRSVLCTVGSSLAFRR